MTREIQVAPSILAGDFGSLGSEAKRAEQAGADALHIDIMDGHFVPNFSLGPRAVAAINRSTELFLDVHIMIYNPYDYIERFVEAGADRITFHFEATEDVKETLEFIRRSGIQAGLAFCPETSFDMLVKYVDQCDLILLMTVEPGFGGQAFMHPVLDKIKLTRELCEKKGVHPYIQVDGGITDETAKLCKEAGANNLVAGTYLFKAPDMQAAIRKLKSK